MFSPLRLTFGALDNDGTPLFLDFQAGSRTTTSMSRVPPNDVLDCLAAHKARMLDGLSALIRIPTENPPGNYYRECQEELLRQLQELGLEAEPIGSACVQSTFGSDGPAVYFHGHYDVVPASDVQQFTPAIRNMYIFGRGSADMKGGLVSMMYAVRVLKDLGVRLNGRIVLMFVPDEETGGRRGTSRLVEQHRLEDSAVAMFTAEPTSGLIWNACRGAISIRVTAKGKSAHVGHHYRGQNAFEHALEICRELQALRDEVQMRATAYRISPDAARNSILLLGGEVRGGTNFNVVPDACSFTVDRRINPEQRLSEEKARLLAVLDKYRDTGTLEYEVFQEAEGAGIPETSIAARVLAQQVELVTGRAPVFEMCPGLLEIRFYSQLGVPALAYGPGLLSVSHGPNEYVSVKSLIDCAAIYALSAMELLQN
jgi:succinyl-diaminopimelate desuccinylase